MANRTQKKISFELNIKSVKVSLDDGVSLTVYWVRGRDMSILNIFYRREKD